MRVRSNCPPTPIQTAQNESVVDVVTDGTVHEPLTPVTLGWGVCRSVATTYPAQFVAFIKTGGCVGIGVGNGVGDGESEGVGVGEGVGDGEGDAVGDGVGDGLEDGD